MSVVIKTRIETLENGRNLLNIFEYDGGERVIGGLSEVSNMMPTTCYPFNFNSFCLLRSFEFAIAFNQCTRKGAIKFMTDNEIHGECKYLALTDWLDRCCAQEREPENKKTKRKKTNRRNAARTFW